MFDMVRDRIAISPQCEKLGRGRRLRQTRKFRGACQVPKGAEPNDIHLAGSQQQWCTYGPRVDHEAHTDAARTWPYWQVRIWCLGRRPKERSTKEGSGSTEGTLVLSKGSGAALVHGRQGNRPAAKTQPADLFVHWVIAGIGIRDCREFALVAGVVSCARSRLLSHCTSFQIVVPQRSMESWS